MRLNRSYRIVLFTAVLVALLIFIPFMAHKKGICISEARSFSEREKIDQAISRSILNNSNKVDVVINESGDQKSYSVTLKYANVEDFLEKNPQCCEIVRKNVRFHDGFIEPSFIDWVFGNVWNEIRVIFNTEYADEAGIIHKISKPEFFAVGICSELGNNDVWFEPSDLGPFSQRKFPHLFNIESNFGENDNNSYR